MTMPMLQTNVALGQILLPIFAVERERTGFGRRVWIALAGIVGLSLACWLVLGLLGPQILDWLYAGRYTHLARMLWLVGLLPVLNGLVAVEQGVLRAQQRPRLVFWGFAAASAVSVTGGVAVTYTHGLAGAITGILAAYLVLAATLAWCLR
jgi:O-antigen/teichoic acid export membrane protein